MSDLKYCYRYPHPAVTADCVVFGWDGKDMKVLLIQRRNDPFKGRWAFPGGFMDIDETVEECARRELEEETGLKNIPLEQFHIFSGVGRDPRERVLSVAHIALVKLSEVKGGDDAAKAEWFPVHRLPPLAFDHEIIMQKALQVLRSDKYYNKTLRMASRTRRYSPELISSLLPDEIFVFGSNLQGHHGGGAARAAYNKFGAVWGQGTGLQGQSYAIPTMQGGPETIRPYVDEFIGFASRHTELKFLVTRIGCGIAGFTDSDIAPLFSDALDMENVFLPKSFVKVLEHSAMAADEDIRTGITGAIAGDIIGSVYEFADWKSTDFELFSPQCTFTDDTVMTIAVAQWLLKGGNLSEIMRKWGSRYRDRGYGSRFQRWLFSPDPDKCGPYNSFGNGSAMRVSPCGFYADTLDQALDLARQSAEVTHDHPEGIKGAQAIAGSIFLARKGFDKGFIKDYVQKQFGYDLSRSCDQIRPYYAFDETCQGSCPEAITAFLDSHDYESAIRLAVSLGGDSDTIACMTGGIAAAYYGIPEDIRLRALSLLPEDMKEILGEFPY